MLEGANALIMGGNFSQSINNYGSPGVCICALGLVGISETVTTGMDLLKQKIASAAFYNAAIRRDHPQCHPDTRVAVQKKIMDWVQDPARDFPFMWLSGPAGSGKTAIGHTIADTCKTLAATFFVSGVAVEHHETAFVPTLVYQFAQHIPGFREEIMQVLENNPAIFDLTLETQIVDLLIQPLNKVYKEKSDDTQINAWPKLIILDAFEECGDVKLQCRILKILCRVAEEAHILLRFLVISRPMPGHVSLKTQKIFLDESHDPGTDIRTFLKFKFIGIPSLDYTEQSWYSERDIELIAQKSSGQFIYASSVIRYLESVPYTPIDRLQICLGHATPVNTEEKPFTDLDTMFQNILASIAVHLRETLLEILAILLIPNILLTESHLMGFLHPDKKSLVVLHALCSLVAVPSLNNSLGQHLRFFHISLCDFLRDQSRSKEFFIDLPSWYPAIVKRSLRNLASPNITPDGNFAARSILRECLYSVPLIDGLHNDLCELDFGAHLKWLSSPNRSQAVDPQILPTSGLIWDAVPSHTPFRILDAEVQKLVVFFRQKGLFSQHEKAFDDWLHYELGSYPERLRRNEFIAIFRFGKTTCQKYLEEVYTILTDDLILYQFVDNYFAEKSVVYMNSLPHPLPLDSEYITVLRHFFKDERRSGEYCFNDQKFAGLAFRMLNYLLETDPHDGGIDRFNTRKKALKAAVKLLPNVLSKATTSADFGSEISRYHSLLLASPNKPDNKSKLWTALDGYSKPSSQDRVLSGVEDTNMDIKNTLEDLSFSIYSLKSQLSETSIIFDTSDSEQASVYGIAVRF